MYLKITLILIISCITIVVWSCTIQKVGIPMQLDEKWWNGLSEEWKRIILINQNLELNNVDIWKVQKDYINRLNEANKPPKSELNTSLRELHNERRFSLGYEDFYKRAVRRGFAKELEPINLDKLNQLRTFYMVNGPGDLSPLAVFPQLTTLIINNCGVDNSVTLDQQELNLRGIIKLRKLKILHVSSHSLKDLTPIKNFVDLEVLFCDQSSLKSLDVLKNLINLKYLSVGPGIQKCAAISSLNKLEELSLDGFKKIPGLSKLDNLKKLSISEGEMAIVNGSWRIESMDFFKNLNKLEFLDVEFTSIKGDLSQIINKPSVKAITLPGSIKNQDVTELMNNRKNIIVINSYDFK